METLQRGRATAYGVVGILICIVVVSLASPRSAVAACEGTYRFVDANGIAHCGDYVGPKCCKR